MSNFKIHFFAAILFLAPSLMQGQVPQKVHELEVIYQEEIVKASQSIDGKYLAALNVLVKRYTAQKNFEAAIVVKKEIDRVAAIHEKNEPKFPPIGESRLTKAKVDDPNDLSKWKGRVAETVVFDGKIESLKIEANPRTPQIISCVFPVENAKEAAFTFAYKASAAFKSSKEKPFEVHGVYSTGASIFRQTTATFDNEWHEYTWPFNDFRQEKEIRFEIRIMPGEGTVYFNKLEVELIK